MGRVRYGLALALMMTSTVLVGFGASDVNAATLAQAGWWWRAQGGTGLAPGAAPPLPGSPVPPPALPSPPTVPEGGLMVAGTPEGATAIAALRFELTADETMPVLTLQIERESGAPAAVLAACLTGSAWQPTAAGNWADKPFAACAEGSVNGVLSDDGTAFTFALGPLLSNGLVDVVLVPGTIPEAPAGANGSAFEVVFQAPTTASLQTTSGSPPDSASFDVPEIGGGDFGGDPGSDGGGAFSPPPSPTSSTGDFTPAPAGDTSFAAPSPPAPDANVAFTPALEEEEQGLTFTAPVVEAASRPIAATSDDGVDPRLLAGLILAIGAAGLVWSSQQATPVPSPLLARFGAGAVARASTAAGAAPGVGPAVAPGGIGRFARVRTGTAPRL